MAWGSKVFRIIEGSLAKNKRISILSEEGAVSLRGTVRSSLGLSSGVFADLKNRV